ncbi:MAG: hypothetical protein BWY60_00447 [Actinobacteria bacterium ADurb.Bin346]|nr:MAG: hypothetical protein BWY60_00447 [Actinobacteria bacterium ADurb.Bin346]
MNDTDGKENLLNNSGTDEKNHCSSTSKLNVGGQAVLEGVMMRSRRFWAVAVRKPDHTIATGVFKEISVMNRKKVLGWPFIRGIVALVENLALGFKALSYSVNESTGEEVNISKKQMSISVIIAVIFTVGVFFVAPTLIGRLFSSYISNSFLYNIIEGLIRIAFLLGYIAIVSFMKDIRRLFQYHGAEHKTIQAYENGVELTAENIKKYSRLHLRCGTSFLLIVMIVALIVFALLGKPPLYLRLISRVFLIPVIAGISYELIRLAGKFSRYRIINILFYPGLLLQKITTREPDESQIEVAVSSLKKILEAEESGAADTFEQAILAKKDDVAINA